MKLLLDHGGGGGGYGGGDASNDTSEMFAIAKIHKKLDLYEKAIERGATLAEFRAEVLAAIRTNDANYERQMVTRSDIGPMPGGPMPSGLGRSDGNSVADALWRNPEFQLYRERRGKQSGGFSTKIEIPCDFSQRATLLTTTGLTSYERPPGIVLLHQQPVALSSLFTTLPTSAATVRVPKETSYTQAATAVGEEGSKPEASFDLEEVDFPVRKIAVFGRVSDEIVTDFPSVRE